MSEKKSQDADSLSRSSKEEVDSSKDIESDTQVSTVAGNEERTVTGRDSDHSRAEQNSLDPGKLRGHHVDDSSSNQDDVSLKESKTSKPAIISEEQSSADRDSKSSNQTTKSQKDPKIDEKDHGQSEDDHSTIKDRQEEDAGETKMPLTEPKQPEIVKQEVKDISSQSHESVLGSQKNLTTKSNQSLDETALKQVVVSSTESQSESAKEQKKDSSLNIDASTNEYFTVDDVVAAGGYGKFQKLLTFLAGLGWLADAFEIFILSILGDILACDWFMHRWQNALMSSIVFVGMMCGAPTFGYLADRYGRRKALGVSMLLLFAFGSACAGAPNYIALVIFRGLMGFSLGGIAQGVTLCCEYYPATVRGRVGFYLSYYWAVGAVGVVLAAWFIMKLFDNWRVFLFVGAVPSLIVFLSMKWYPESARYYLVSNQKEKALATLERMISMNKAEMPKGTLEEVDAVSQRGKIKDLFKPSIRRSTWLFLFIWWAVAMTYYGTALIAPHIVANGSLLKTAESAANSTFSEYFTQKMECVKYTDREYLDLVWTSAAEFPGILFFTLVVERIERKILLGSTCIFVALLNLLLQLEIKPEIAMLIILFITRGLLAGIFQMVFIMTTEAFPTTLRASAMGAGSGFARFGGIIAPIVTQVVVLSRPHLAVSFLSLIMCLAGISSFLLPLETKGRDMQECVG